MLKYREFLDLTDEEIKFIINELFFPTKIENIRRNKQLNEISLDMTVGGKEDSNRGGMKETGEVILGLPIPGGHCGIYVDLFSLDRDDPLKWKQFLLAKGCDYRLKDNPYLERKD